IYIITLRQYGEYIKKPVALKKISIQQSLSVENVPTPKEYRSFVEWLLLNEKWQVYWIVRVLGMTGMRLSELRQVKWADILSGDFYPRCKGKKHRIVYFPKQLVADVREWIKTNPIDHEQLLVAKKLTGPPLSDRGISQNMKIMALKAGFPKEKAHCHAFRHFFAKQYLAKTKDIIQLAELLGHESVDTTRLYLQKSKEEQKRDINRNIDW
ncbi:MAG: tyrosine-type recombinase/integrase, partial [Muribaculaceae bacterium]|nr:tyrosine-type recombinase/integrase [Muribaculaceae bacterium]